METWFFFFFLESYWLFGKLRKPYCFVHTLNPRRYPKLGIQGQYYGEYACDLFKTACKACSTHNIVSLPLIAFLKELTSPRILMNTILGEEVTL